MIRHPIAWAGWRGRLCRLFHGRQHQERARFHHLRLRVVWCPPCHRELVEQQLPAHRVRARRWPGRCALWLAAAYVVAALLLGVALARIHPLTFVWWGW